MKIGLGIFILVIVLLTVVYLTWENRGSNELLLKVFSFFMIGLLSIFLAIFFQNKKEDIVYKTTTSIFVDNNNLPIIYIPNIEGKDHILLEVLSTMNENNISLENNSFDETRDFLFDLVSRSFINMFETLYHDSWYIKYDYNELTNATTWGKKGEEQSDFISINDVDIFLKIRVRYLFIT